MQPRIKKLRGTACKTYHHYRLACRRVGVCDTGVQVAAEQVVVSPAQFGAVAAYADEVAYYVVGPISGDGVVDADVPAVSGQYEVLYYHFYFVFL